MKSESEALADAHRRGSRATRRIKGSDFPARRDTRVCMLSPDAVRALSPPENVMIFPACRDVLVVNEGSAPLLVSGAVT